MTVPRSILHALPCCLALLAGCDRMPGKPDRANQPVPADQIKDFAALYGMYCAGCHGADGRLGPAPPLNDAIFLSIVPDAELFKLVDQGRPGTPMPGFSQQHGGPLTDAQVEALAKGIKSRWIDSETNRNELAKLGGDLPTYAFTRPADETAAAARGAGDFRPGLCRVPRRRWKGRGRGLSQRARLFGACQRSGAAANHHYRSGGPGNAELRNGRGPAPRFSTALFGRRR